MRRGDFSLGRCIGEGGGVIFGVRVVVTFAPMVLFPSAICLRIFVRGGNQTHARNESLACMTMKSMNITS